MFVTNASHPKEKKVIRDDTMLEEQKKKRIEASLFPETERGAVGSLRALFLNDFCKGAWMYE